jgi:hypothetical protein
MDDRSTISIINYTLGKPSRTYDDACNVKKYNNFQASVYFLKKFANKTFIVQNCAKIPTKTPRIR